MVRVGRKKVARNEGSVGPVFSGLMGSGFCPCPLFRFSEELGKPLLIVKRDIESGLFG